ncbi:RING-H2 finger protein ATL67-like [Solanum pennellii]|uniref:RING-H2 finger protein ATL67-like n=1 Tax=Solanum pennellii TaxID=28526 RepID=A0ABM1UWN0_SOLPN|nr:RING-H2 finger protein ATL67-like [Solanum pennellii]
MSTSPSAAHGGPPPPLTTTNTLIESLNKIGLGYAIAIALAFLFLLSTLILSSYLCCRSAAYRRRQAQSRTRNPNTGIYIPSVIFVAEEDENDDVSSQNTYAGLNQAVINSYPKLIYSNRNGNWGNGNGNGSRNDVVCAICLCDYKEAEMLRMLPECKHYFHVMCIDAWLKLNASCPVCRNSPLPTPMSTPLSEVVPLSQYSDGRRRH